MENKPVTPSSPDLSVVIPCFNEENNVRNFAQEIYRVFEPTNKTVELVFIDDGSTDSTWECITSLSAASSLVKGIQHEQNSGIAPAWRSGLASASGRLACLIDADFQNRPEDILALLNELNKTGVDLVQAVREPVDEVPWLRSLLSRVLNKTLNLTFRQKAADSKSGFIVAPLRILNDIVTFQGPYRHPQTFIGVSARSRGYAVAEVKCPFEKRVAGHSFLDGRSFLVSAEVLLDLPRAHREFGSFTNLRTVSNTFPSPKTSSYPHPYRGWRRIWYELFFSTMPLHKWMITRRARRLHLELHQTDRFNREELDDLQSVKLRRIVDQAYNHSVYYRKRFDELNISPTDIRTISDIAQLPMLSKNDVRGNGDDMLADNVPKSQLLKVTTSGSTGEPFTLFADRHQLELRMATTLRALEWTGWRFGDRQARLWHQTLGMSRSQIIREHIDAWFMRRLFIPAFELNPENLEKFVDTIRKHRPKLVDGYAESLNFLAAYIESGGSADFSPQAMMSSAQALPDGSRKLIEEGFSTQVFDKYGSREFSGIAYECVEGTDHHVMDESYLVELIVDGRPAQPGEVGEVVITDLSLFGMPIIRYRIGDLAVAVEQGTCPCGRDLSRIGRIEGRTQAIVHCGNGTWLPGTFFAHFFKDRGSILRMFQINQSVPGAFNLDYVRGEQFSEESLQSLLSELRNYVGEETIITLNEVDSVPLLKTGKRSPVVSTVNLDFQNLGSRLETPTK